MSKIIDYKIIEEKSLTVGQEERGFQQTIVDLIGKGWQPYGKPFLSSKDYLIQPMVKYSDPWRKIKDSQDDNS